MFKDRKEAAGLLARKLSKYKKKKNVVILAVPRGGLQTGNVLAKELDLPLAVILTKKISYPGDPEAAIGAVSLTGIVLDERIKVPQDYIDSETKEIRELLKKRYKKYVGKKKPLSMKGKIVILVDDGVATGNTMIAAVDLLRKNNPQKIVVAIPVGPPDTIERLKRKAEEVICLHKPHPSPFFAIAMYYDQFEQVEDEEAIRLLKEANR